MVVEVFISKSQDIDPFGDEFLDRMLDYVCVKRVDKTGANCPATSLATCRAAQFCAIHLSPFPTQSPSRASSPAELKAFFSPPPDGEVAFSGGIFLGGNGAVSGSTFPDGKGAVSGSTLLGGNGAVSGGTFPDGNGAVSGSTLLGGKGAVSGSTLLGGKGAVSGSTFLGGNGAVSGSTFLGGNGAVSGSTFLGGNGAVSGSTFLGGNGAVSGSTFLGGNGAVSRNTFRGGKGAVSRNTFRGGVGADGFCVFASTLPGVLTLLEARQRQGYRLQSGQQTRSRNRSMKVDPQVALALGSLGPHTSLGKAATRQRSQQACRNSFSVGEGGGGVRGVGHESSVQYPSQTVPCQGSWS
ncbi:MAG: hypothetical protein ABSG53_12915 [Thermoguttaceae bacterium]